MAPHGLLIPLILLASVATVIASQSIISGAFCITQQAVQLGYLPRITARHTSTESRGQVFTLGEGLRRIVIRYGFVEIPDIPAALAAVDLDFDPKAAAYFLSRQTLVPSRKPGMPLWQDHLFAAMVRNSETSMSFFKLPVNRVVELGSQVEI